MLERPSTNPSDLHSDPAFYFYLGSAPECFQTPRTVQGCSQAGGMLLKGLPWSTAQVPDGPSIITRRGPPFEEAGPRPLQPVGVSLLGKTLKSKVASAVVKCDPFLLIIFFLLPPRWVSIMVPRSCTHPRRQRPLCRAPGSLPRGTTGLRAEVG